MMFFAPSLRFWIYFATTLIFSRFPSPSFSSVPECSLNFTTRVLLEKLTYMEGISITNWLSLLPTLGALCAV